MKTIRFAWIALLLIGLLSGVVVAAGPNINWGGPQVMWVNGVNAFGAKCDGSTDDSAKIQLCAQATALSGQCCYLPACTTPYVIANPITLTSNSCVAGSPGTVLKSTMSSSVSSADNSVFFANVTYAGASTTLASAPTKGSQSFHVASASGFTAGQSILVAAAASTGLNTQQFTIESVYAGDGGAGTATITVDDPIVFSFQTSDVLQGAIPPTNIQLYGNGATISGTGDRAIELAVSNHSIIDGWNVTTTYGTFTTGGESFDTAGRDNVLSRATIDMGGTGDFCTSIESNVRTVVRGERCLQPYNKGFWIAGSVDGAIESSSVVGNGTVPNYGGALLTTAGSGDVDGTQRWKVAHSTFERGAYGIYMQAPSTALTVTDSTASYNATSGLVLNKGSASTPITATVTNFTATDMAGSGSGINVADSGHILIASNLILDRDNYGMVFYGSGEVSVIGAEMTVATSATMFNLASGSAGLQLTVSNATLHTLSTENANTELINVSGAGDIVRVSDSLFIADTGASGPWNFADIEAVSTDTFQKCRTGGTATASHGIYIGSVAAVVRVLDGCDFSSSSTPLTVGSGFFNRGTVAAAGTALVAVPFTNMQATETLTLTPTAAATAGTAYLSYVDAGQPIIKSVSGDTNTYDYNVH